MTASVVDIYRRLRDWLAPELADLVGGVYADVAPEGAPYPFVVIELADVRDISFLGGQPSLVRLVLATHIVDNEGLERIAAIRERIERRLDQLLEDGETGLSRPRRVRQRVAAEPVDGQVVRVETTEYEFLMAG